MRIAVAGAGFQGACVALELARRGHRVHLLDREAEPVTQAGVGNEGKIHLGLTYAKDESERTARTLLRGALHFAPCLDRWIGFDEHDARLSTPFYYGVHRDGQLPPDRIRASFQRVQRLYTAAREATGLRYLHQDDREIFRDAAPEEAEHFDPERLVAVFRTSERSVDPEWIARRLRARVAEEPNVTFVGGADVRAARAPARGPLLLEYEREGQAVREPFDHVVNALWSGRLALDATLLPVPRRRWLLRNKVGVVVRCKEPSRYVPSLTVVLGEYGDVVNYGDGSYYASWYPACLIERGSDLRIPRWSDGLDAPRRARLVADTIAGLAALCPAVSILADEGDPPRLKGGTIFAWGAHDIDHLHSELHTRHDIGVRSHGHYHSIDTGKYTMAPWFAMEVADRVCALGGA